MARLQSRHSKPPASIEVSPSRMSIQSSCTWHATALVVLFVSLAAFALLLLLVLANNKAPLAIDAATLQCMVSLRSDTLTGIMSQITSIIMPAVLLMCAISMSVFAKGVRPGIASLTCAGGAAGLNWAVKHLISRPRPPQELRLAIETSASFPSGHAVTAMAFYGFLIWLVWHCHQSGVWRTMLVTMLALAIAVVDVSRLYLGVHYLTDVIAGSCFSLAWLVIYTRLIVPRILVPDD